MLKPQSLFDHLSAAVPAFRTSPDQLSMLVRSGRIVAAGGPSLSFEYRYTVQLVALDFAGHPDAIMVPLLAWLRANQPEVADNPELRDKSVRFEAEYLNRQAVDLSIEVDLTERVIVGRRPAGAEPDPVTTFERWDVRHVGEPARLGVVDQAEHWEIYERDELIATWDIVPVRA
ncbi:phage tail protein [Ideonella sp. YS5]|uniref:phage tail protein n=1 Tax=Ideonella sp. YS5 TaxID=3453714 RepID=UPI003EED7626